MKLSEVPAWLGMELSEFEMWCGGYLERHGRRFLVDFGYGNVVEKAKELKRTRRYATPTGSVS